MLEIRKLRMEFESYRDETQREFQKLKYKQRTNKEKRSELLECPEEMEKKGNRTETQYNLSNSE